MNNQLISKLFMAREKFILIGLTGRTGSGCTTAANILGSTLPLFPDAKDIRYNAEPYFGTLDIRRYEILKKYSQANWLPFISIKVSDLISGYLLALPSSTVIEFIQRYTPTNKKISEEEINKVVEKAFSKSYILKKYNSYQQLILNHDQEISFNSVNLKNFIKYLKLIRKFTRDFKNELNKLETGLYVSVYQAAGNSIRKTGKILTNYQEKPFEPEKVFQLPTSINRVIKCLRNIYPKVFIVIDAIRNPHETRFFRDRYSAFYLMSINAPNQDREDYLQRVHKFNVDQLRNIEEKESGNTSDEFGYFISQNVKKMY